MLIVATVPEMTVDFGFEPDPSRAQELDRRMHTSLAASLEHIREVAVGTVSFDESGIDRLIQSLHQGDRYRPMLFRDYYALADALYADDKAIAEAQFARLAGSRPSSGGLSIESLRDPAHDAKSAIYQQMMTGDSGAEMAVLPPAADVAERFVERFQKGMELMDHALPALSGEVRAIVREVVCVSGDPSRKMQFDGGSHFQLWGALMLNADFHPTPQAIVEVVAHESAHSLLFAFCTDEPLVYNDDEDLYPSPLRHDLRPMDGLYHATFVSARMHWAMSRLLESGALAEEDRAGVIAAREADFKNFQAGYSVVSAHADLSGIGARLMDGARAYIDGVRA